VPPSVLVPAHITGFFYPLLDSPDPLRQGSLGAGVSLQMGMRTEAEFLEGEQGSVEVWINGEQVEEAPVSRRVGELLLLWSRKSGKLVLRHEAYAPIGAGFGMSGAAALGAALAGARALGLALRPLQLAQLAHLVEVEQRTGLGTVIAEYYGGLELRLRPGAPGIGQLIKLKLAEPYYVLASYNGPMSTRALLSSQEVLSEVRALAPSLLARLLREPSAELFMRLSHEFSLALTGVPGAVKEELRRLRQEGLLMAMAMFGHTYFTLVPESRLDEERRRASQLIAGRRLYLARVDEEGLEGRLLYEDPAQPSQGR